MLHVEATADSKTNMKVRVRMHFEGDYQELLRLLARFQGIPEATRTGSYPPASVAATGSTGWVDFEVWMDDPEFEELRNAFESEANAHTYRETTVYEQGEVECAQWLWLKELGTEWPDSEITYERGCLHCGQGGTPVTPAKIHGKIRGGRDFGVAESALIVSSRVASRLKADELTGFSLLPVAGKSKVLENYFWLWPDTEIGPIEGYTKLEELAWPKPCSCRRLGVRLASPEIVRCPETVLGREQDFYRSAEWLGGALVTAPLLIVSQRAFQSFASLSLRDVEFAPVFLV